jgi:glycylpeptide N-tetradecanoyltransferase
VQEITRRVNLRGIWQAAYTAGVVLPKPVATCQYWHRSLNPKKLIDIGFSRLQVELRMMACDSAAAPPHWPSRPEIRASYCRIS